MKRMKEKKAEEEAYTISEGAEDWLVAREVIREALEEWGLKAAPTGPDGRDQFRFADAILARLAHKDLLAVRLRPVERTKP